MGEGREAEADGRSVGRSVGLFLSAKCRLGLFFLSFGSECRLATERRAARRPATAPEGGRPAQGEALQASARANPNRPGIAFGASVKDAGIRMDATRRYVGRGGSAFSPPSRSIARVPWRVARGRRWHLSSFVTRCDPL